MISWEEAKRNQVWPACVGLSRIGNYPNTIHTLWNDMSIGSKPIPWYYRLVPMRFLSYNNRGVVLKLFQ